MHLLCIYYAFMVIIALYSIVYSYYF